MTEYEDEVRKEVLKKIDLSKDLSNEEVKDLIDEVIIAGAGKSASLKERLQARKIVYDSLRGLDVLQPLVDDEDITEIMVNGAGNIFYEKDGAIMPWKQGFASPEKLENTIQNIVAGSNRIVNEASPIVDTRLPDGSRVNIVLAPIAIDGSVITIRKFPKEPMTMDRLLRLGSISPEIVDFLKLMVKSGANIFISGGTGSGKTTFLNALSQFIPGNERVITIEDSAELQIEGVANLVRLECRQTNLENVAEISIRHLIKTALRMRPDRLIVGECRGAEALDMLQSMNTGHDGSMSTGHANSCQDMLSRIETMVLMGMDLPLHAIRGQIASGVDIMVHLSRLRDRSRKLIDVVEVLGYEDGEIKLNPLYHFEEAHGSDDRVDGRWVCVGKLVNRDKLQAAGLKEEYERLSQI